MRVLNSLAKYLVFLTLHVFIFVSIVGIMLGGIFMWSGFFLVLLVSIGDYVLGNINIDDSPNYTHAWILNAMVYASVPFLVLLLFLVFWMTGEGDPFGFGHFVNKTWSIDLQQSRQQSTMIDWIGCIFSTGFMLAIGGQNIAHELYHRMQSAFARTQGKWLLATSFDVPLYISHIFGHHKNVGLSIDHTTARRGETSYAFIWRSTIGGNRNAWRVESERLARSKCSTWSLGNRVLRGYAMSLFLCVIFFFGSGLWGLCVLVVSGVMAKALLEIVNYIQHYGLVRHEGQPIGPEYSWNSTNKLSTWLLFNLTFHSHHHAQPSYEFWRLKTTRHDPQLQVGYMSAILIALIPFLWRRFMEPRLKEWDEKYAMQNSRVLSG